MECVIIDQCTIQMSFVSASILGQHKVCAMYVTTTCIYHSYNPLQNVHLLHELKVPMKSKLTILTLFA